MTFNEFLSSLTDEQLVSLFDLINSHWVDDPKIKQIKQEMRKRELLMGM